MIDFLGLLCFAIAGVLYAAAFDNWYWTRRK